MDNNCFSWKDYENGGINALEEAIKAGLEISHECIEEYFNGDFVYVIYEGYETFENNDRRTISKYYIIVINNNYYRCWKKIGLTEEQGSYWQSQRFEPVFPRSKTINAWEEK